ncbi:hypothetical protein LINPERHAP1_LOCUS12879 [Linum perenne]
MISPPPDDESTSELSSLHYLLHHASPPASTLSLTSAVAEQALAPPTRRLRFSIACEVQNTATEGVAAVTDRKKKKIGRRRRKKIGSGKEEEEEEDRRTRGGRSCCNRRRSGCLPPTIPIPPYQQNMSGNIKNFNSPMFSPVLKKGDFFVT